MALLPDGNVILCGIFCCGVSGSNVACVNAEEDRRRRLETESAVFLTNLATFSSFSDALDAVRLRCCGD